MALGPDMIQHTDLSEQTLVPAPDPWSGWAQVYELPASVEHDLADEEGSSTPDPGPASAPPDDAGLQGALGRLADALADERGRRNQAEDALREALTTAQASEVEVARLGAALAAERTQVAQLERDRDDVIRRAEELLTAVRERADQRRAAELEDARRHWSELLTEERRRVEVLDGERASLLKRLEDAWMAGGALRRSRPLRPWAPPPEDVEGESSATDEAMEDDYVEPPPQGETPQLTAEIARMRARLRAQLHKPPDLPDVEDGVDRLRETRLARDKDGRRRAKR
ncbi:MAG: hypothetical protein JWP02_240 [Acidimicrobiales bacterium]|nr:hypothetical protein [Acidimicrobiales bacterium]